MLGHECPNIRVPAAPPADVEVDLHISGQALAPPISYHQGRLDGTLVETFEEVLAPWLDLHPLYVCLWCQRDSSSSELPSEIIVNARLRLTVL